MGDAMIDALLDDLVPRVEQLPAWDEVVRTARRTHRRRVALAAVITMLVAVPSAFAIAHAFEGSPPPQTVSNAVDAMNRMSDMANSYAAQQGFAQHAPHAVPATTHGVVQVQTNDGPVDLWEADSDSGGICLLFDWEADGASPSGVAYSSATCADQPPPSRIDFGSEWSAEHPDYKVAYGVLFVDAATVELRLADGSTTSVPVVEHAFLDVIDNAQRIVSVRALDAAGAELAHQDIGPPPPPH